MANKLKSILDWYFSKSAAPYWMVLLWDCIIVIVSGIISFYLVYGGSSTLSHFWNVIGTFSLFLPGYIVGFRIFHTYSGILRYSSSVDLLRVAGAMAVGATIAFFIHLGLDYSPIAYNIKALTLVIVWMVSTILCLSSRMIVRYLYDSIIYTNNQIRVFVYGVHEGGEALARSIISDKESPYVLSGFVCDEPQMTHHRIFGTKVYLNDANLVETMRQKHVRALFVSPLRNDALRDNPQLLNKLVKNGIKVMMQPSEQEWDGKSDLGATQLHEVEIEDLLPRDKIEVDLQAIGALLKDKVVMVTGAAGSIGYEMVRQVAKFAPRELVLIDQAETPMHSVRLHMAKHYPNIPCETIVSSISNQTKMEAIFQSHRPDYVFHAAAYKHVPMMEDNPSMAVQNNVYGTRVIADLAVKYGTSKFVMISTDKAVNPANVMGCSKRICEIYCQSLNAKIQAEGGGTQFVTTRFGNVLGSNGSVIPIFMEQIRRGGPVTVTHKDIVRFFMLIPEACRLVLEAGTMGEGGEIFVFDMGSPVRIADLAKRMIDLSGAKEVKIEYTGLRDGEKLFEEVLSDAETTLPTDHPKIKVARVRRYSYEDALRNEEELMDASLRGCPMEIVAKMKEIVPEFRSCHSVYSELDNKEQ